MINALKLVNETIMGIKASSGFTPGELKMFLDIYNGTHLNPVSIQHGAGLELSVSDSFDLYPGMYEAKWGTDKTAMLTKIRELTDWQAACLVIWACDFWQSGAYEQEDAINRYIQGKLSVSSLYEEALNAIKRAIELQEKTKGAFKSPAIGEARAQCEKAAKILEILIQGG